MTAIPLSDQIAEVKRELTQRRNVYVCSRRPANQIARMQAVLETLEHVQMFGIDYGAEVRRKRNIDAELRDNEGAE